MSMTTKTLDPADIVAMGVPNYTHGVVVDGATRWLALSGQVGLNPDGSTAAGFEAQADRVFANISACLKEGGMTVDDIRFLRIFVVDRDDIPKLRQARSAFLGPDRLVPSTLVIVSGLVNPDWLLEVEVVAAQ